MTPAQQAKAAGLKSLTQIVEFHGLKENGQPLLSLNTLTNWHRDKPELFKTTIIGTAYQLGLTETRLKE